MGRVSAEVTVRGRAAEAEAVWYDPSRWASWIEDFAQVVKLDPEWPERGARRVWDSRPGGRGRVAERVERYESRTGQSLAVEDARLEGTQRVAFEPGPESVRVTLTLEYRLKDRSPLTPLIDLLVVRRRIGDAQRRTLRRFASEVAAERQFGSTG